FDDDVLARMKLGQFEVGLGPPRIDPQDLAAKGDGVVEEPLVGIEVDRALVGAHGSGGIVDFEVEIADSIVERKIGTGFGAGLDLLDGLQVDVYGLPPLLLLLELPRRVFQLFQIHAARTEKRRTGIRLGATETYRAAEGPASSRTRRLRSSPDPARRQAPPGSAAPGPGLVPDRPP